MGTKSYEVSDSEKKEINGKTFSRISLPSSEQAYILIFLAAADYLRMKFGRDQHSIGLAEKQKELNSRYSSI